MRRTLALLLAAVCVLCIAACQRAKSLTSDAPTIEVRVDPRMELLAAVQLLSGYGEKYKGLITESDFPYKQDMAKYFAPYKNHRAVKLFAQMSDGFCYDAPPAAMLFLTDPPELKLRLPFSDYIKGRAGGEKQLTAFVQALRDFARESKFEVFYKAHKQTYQAIDKAMGKEVKDSPKWIKALEDYYGKTQSSYTIVTSPLFGYAAYGPRVELPNGKFEIYEICGPQEGIRDGVPVFGKAENIKYLAWHEFGHSFANPLGDKNQKELTKYSSLLDPIAQKMKEQAYGNWMTCVNEHVVRAVEIRLLVAEQGEDAEEGLMAGARSRGFAYIEPLCKKLEEYEQHRDKYPTLESFYPEIVGVFKSLSEQKLGPEFYQVRFPGTINAVSMDRKNLVVILPTHESDSEAQRKLQDFARSMHDRFWKDAPVFTDDEALKQDFSGKSVIAYGTMTGNSWIAGLSAELPFKIEADRIVADKEYTGGHLRFITAWPNPKNPQKGILIYTAQQAADVVGINGVFHGPTDFVVAKGNEVLQAGDYVKHDGKWAFK
jgi:hypothetical protein